MCACLLFFTFSQISLQINANLEVAHPAKGVGGRTGVSLAQIGAQITVAHAAVVSGIHAARYAVGQANEAVESMQWKIM